MKVSSPVEGGAVNATLERVEAVARSSWKHYIRREPAFAFQWHFHPEFELILITKGSGRRFVGDSLDAYEAGDLTLLGPDLPHTFMSASERGMQEAAISQFKRDVFGADFFGTVDLEPVARLLRLASRGVAFVPDGRSTD